MPTDPMLKEVARQALYRLAPDRWVARELGMTPDPWQVTLLRTPPGSQVIALTGRQAGKTQAACWAASHVAVFELGALSVVACPSQRQSAEAVRRVKAALVKAGVKLKGDNVFAVETVAGARILALPGDESTSRGLSVDGVIIADEAARLSPEMISALRPMRARFADTARFMMLSTAWSRSDPFWQVWESDDPSWVRIRSLADNNPTVLEGVPRWRAGQPGRDDVPKGVSGRAARPRRQSVRLEPLRPGDFPARAESAARGSVYAAGGDRALGRKSVSRPGWQP